MARQFNFFALGEDQEFVCHTLFSMLPEVHVLPDRGPEHAMVPSRLATEEDLLNRTGPGILYLVQGRDAHRLVFYPLKGGLKRVANDLCPVIEYLPSHVTQGGSLHVGRIMCACHEEADLLRVFNRIARRMKKQGQADPADKHFWIYPCAGREAQLLQFWGMTKPVTNPLYGSVR